MATITLKGNEIHTSGDLPKVGSKAPDFLLVDKDLVSLESYCRLDRPASRVLEELAKHNIVGGHDLHDHYPELGHALLVCATETKTAADIQLYVEAMREILA